MPNQYTLFDIQGRTAVITGGSGGLGSAIAYALAEEGARVAVISLHAASSAKVVEHFPLRWWWAWVPGALASAADVSR